MRFRFAIKEKLLRPLWEICDKNSDGTQPFSQHAGDGSRDDRNPDDEALELPEKNRNRADGFSFINRIGMVSSSAFGPCCASR
jgi:hypothetical protein